MQFVKKKPPEPSYANRPGARAKRQEVALGRPGFEPGHISAWLSFRPSQGHPKASCNSGGSQMLKIMKHPACIFISSNLRKGSGDL
jgi:hypothetical protein